MAGKKGQENYDALGSIFDFLFAEAKKAPDKRKPIRPTGIAGDTQLTDAIAASLEKPGAFISETVVDEFNSVLDIELYAEGYRGVGKVKVTSNNLVDLIKDPVGFVDKSLKTTQVIRKGMRASFLGQTMVDFMNTGWAQKYGDQEIKDAIHGITDAREIDKIKQRMSAHDIAKAFGETAASEMSQVSSTVKDKRIPGRFELTGQSYMANRAGELVGRRIFGAEKWASMSDEDRANFLFRVQGTSGSIKKDDMYDFVSRAANTEGEKQEFRRKIDNFYDNHSPDKNTFVLWSTDSYKSLEDEELTLKIEGLGNARSLSDEDEKRKKMYEKTRLLLRKDLNSLRSEVSRLKAELSATSDKNLRRDLKKELKDTKKAIDAISGATFWGQIGRWEGYFNSLQNIYGGVGMSSLGANILSGDFFDKNKNKLLRPNAEAAMDIDEIAYEFFIPDIRSKGRDKTNALTAAYNRMGTTMYYMTPRSIFRTLFYNGEGFAFLMYQGINGLKNEDFLKDDKGILSLIDESIKSGNYYEGLNDLLSRKLTPEQLRIFERKMGGIHNLRRMTKAFSIPHRIKTYFMATVIGEKAKHARVWFARKLLSNPGIKKWFTKNAAGKLLGRWIAKGGFDVLARSIVTGITSALGIAGGPIASFLIGAATWLLTDAILKTAAKFLNYLKYLILGILAILIIFFGWSGYKTRQFFKQNAVAHTVAPGTVWQCALYNPVEVDPDNPDYPWGPAIIPPPSNEECILETQAPACTQGWVGDNLYSHGGIKSLMPIDLASDRDAGTVLNYVYAPQFCDNGNCRITQVGQITCPSDGKYAGGTVIFEASTGSVTYTFRMYHVRPLASVNQQLSGGEPVVSVQYAPEIPVTGNCWTGAHIHFEVKQNGTPVNPLDLLDSFNCSVNRRTCP